MDVADSRKRYLGRHKKLLNLRASYEAHWKELADYVKPRRSRLFREPSNSAGRKKHDKIINNTAGRSLSIMGSGMMAGITSPARQWFRMTTPNQDLAQRSAVKEWLHQVEQVESDVIEKSNTYTELQQLYDDLGLFAPGVIVIEEDSEQAIRAYSVPVGEYCLAADSRGRATTLYRELRMTVEQLVDKFGEDAVKASSPRIGDLYANGNYDEEFDVLHVIEPRRKRDPSRIGPLHMPYASVWMLSSGDAVGFLRESGFSELPFMAPRWSCMAGEVYGSSPAMEALGDVKSLQIYERSSASAAEKLVDPPLAGSADLEGMPVSLIPGAQNFYEKAGDEGLRPLFQVPPEAITVIERKVLQHENRIKSAFYADLWLMLTQSDGPQMTAEEVRERHEEKMLQLGPVMERLEDELLNPLISRVFGILMRTGRLPPPPPELKGQDLVVEYDSIMSQAQKLVGIGSLERFVNFVARLGEVKPEALDKLDVDKVVNKYGDSLGVDVVVPDDVAQQARAARAQQQQQAAAAQQAMAATQATKNLAQADTSGDNALTRVVGPVAAAQVNG